MILLKSHNLSRSKILLCKLRHRHEGGNDFRRLVKYRLYRLQQIMKPFWGFVNDNVYIPPMPVDLQELHDRTVNDIALVYVTFSNKLWD
jgi:hypothetical protein